MAFITYLSVPVRDATFRVVVYYMAFVYLCVERRSVQEGVGNLVETV